MEKAIWDQLSFEHGPALTDTVLADPCAPTVLTDTELPGPEYAPGQAQRAAGHRPAAAAVAPARGAAVTAVMAVR